MDKLLSSPLFLAMGLECLLYMRPDIVNVKCHIHLFVPNFLFMQDSYDITGIMAVTQYTWIICYNTSLKCIEILDKWNYNLGLAL